MKVEKILSERLDQLVESKALKAIDMISSSDSGQKFKAELNRLLELLTPAMNERTSSVLLEFRDKYEDYVQIIAECSYSLGLCDALIFAQN